MKTERINLIINNWKKSNGIGRVIIPQQFGKQFIVSKSIDLFINKNPTKEIYLIVDNSNSQFQWYQWILNNELYKVCKVYTIKYILSNLENYKSFPFIIFDDIYNENLINSILKIKHKFILHISTNYNLNILNNIPIVDIISKEESVKNNWINNYKEYKIILDVDNINEYKDHDTKFWKYMTIFNYDIKLLSNCLSSKECRYELSKLKNVDIKLINACTFGANRELNWRKNFVLSHPKKLEIINKIIEYNLFKRIIVFFPTINLSNQLNCLQYNSSITDKKLLEVENEINKNSPILLSAVNIIPKSNFDIIIITSNNSSNYIKENKLKIINNNGLIFTLVIKNTMEEAWFKSSTLDNDYITITEKMLYRLLDGKEILEERIEGPEMIYNY